MSLMGSIGRRIFFGGLELGSGIKNVDIGLNLVWFVIFKISSWPSNRKLAKNHKTKIRLVWRELVFQNTSSLLLHIL